MIVLMGVSQANRTYLEMAKLLNQASEDQKIQFAKSSFELYDANKDGFVTSGEFDNADFRTLPFNSLIRETMTEALIQFEQKHENGIEPIRIGITFEDYKDTLKRKLEQIYFKKVNNFSYNQVAILQVAKLLNQASEDEKIQSAKSSFEIYDRNNDGFITSDEFDNVNFRTLHFKSISLPFIREVITEAFIQFEQEHENGFEPNKIGITIEDYKDAIKGKLEQIYGKRSVSQDKRTNLEMAELNLVSEDLKIRFFKASFKLYDSNKDGFVTSHEFHNVYFGTLPYNSLIRETMTEALIQFEQEHKNGIEPNKIGITLEDYKDALKRKFEKIYDKKSK